MIDWNISKEDMALAVRVAQRALRELTDYPDDRRTLVIDLNACHSNGCPLYFKGLLESDLQDLSHDICGIRDHINRDTGKLEDGFTPRYAKANHPDPEPGHEWVSIDGQQYLCQEADFLLEKGLIEPCAHEECPHHYHACINKVDSDLLAALEQAGKLEDLEFTCPECAANDQRNAFESKVALGRHRRFAHGVKPMDMIDITPAGMQTPEGIKRVSEKGEMLQAANVVLADLAQDFVEKHRLVLIESVLNNDELRRSLLQLKVAVEMRRGAQEEFLRAVAGQPSTPKTAIPLTETSL